MRCLAALVLLVNPLALQDRPFNGQDLTGWKLKGPAERSKWKAVFIELASDLRQPQEQRRYPGIRAEDLSFMAPLAVQRAVSEADCIAVCEAVGRCRLRSALPEVAKLLTSDLVMVRANAAAAIRDAGDPGYAAHLRLLLQDRHSVVRSVAAHALGRLRDRPSIPDLVKLLRDPSKDVRWWTLRSLADLEAKEVLSDVLGLESDPDESVRAEAARVAAELKKP